MATNEIEKRKRKVYCQIISCVNNLGTLNKEEAMFRLVLHIHFMMIKCMVIQNKVNFNRAIKMIL